MLSQRTGVPLGGAREPHHDDVITPTVVWQLVHQSHHQSARVQTTIPLPENGNGKMEGYRQF